MTSDDWGCGRCRRSFAGETTFRAHRPRGRCIPDLQAAGFTPLMSRPNVWGRSRRAGVEWFGVLVQMELPGVVTR